MTTETDYPMLANCIASEWDENVVNISYLTKQVVDWIDQQINDGCTWEQMETMCDHWPVNAIILCLEPDCINGTSHRSTWFYSTREQLCYLNKQLICAFASDLPY